MWDELMKDSQKLKKINETAFNVIDINNDGAIQRHQLEDIMMLTAEEMEIQKPSKEEIK